MPRRTICWSGASGCGDILSREAFENAIAVVCATGGSTNAVLHLLAIAHEAQVSISLDDFTRISARTPYIADMKPGGRYVMADLNRSGGVPLVMKRLMLAGLVHGGPITVTGRTVAENLEDVDAGMEQAVVPSGGAAPVTYWRVGDTAREPRP